MAEEVKTGDIVHLKWAGSVAEGRVIEVISERAEILSKDKLIARNGTAKNPAVIIEHKSGNHVIKLKSELI